ncbi:alpha/beta hydrolase [Curvivirga aplysinae]|uniref:alpha/beta hydrolase n=1 Tax=Curvivirga aplysinae TaxID=2529852 RepID=UPI0012BD80EA|nr:alpha/beta hydrolase-fold protein [Curvivirga aplysinae]MTI11064.1 alpha/beta hydrolase [Curvivirga aplysinae]
MKNPLKLHIWGLITLCIIITFGPNHAYADNNANSTKIYLKHVNEYEIHPDQLDIPLKLYIIRPESYDTSRTYPVVYAFDADLSLGMMTTLTSLVSRMARRSDLKPPIVVSIGYGDLKKAFERRLKDLTPYADHYDLPKRPNGKKWSNIGGGDDFLDILIQDIKPFVESRYNVDTSAETLYGHSLGGLLTLHALHSKTEHFERFAAASPSLWFNKRQIINDIIDFHNTLASTNSKVPLRLTVGGEEEELTGWSEKYSKNADFRRKWLKENRMVSNVNELQDMLFSTEGRIDVEFKIYGGLEHAIANAPAFYDALRFAIEPYEVRN